MIIIFTQNASFYAEVYNVYYYRHWRDHTCWKLMVKLPNVHSTCWCVWLSEFMAMMLMLLLRYIVFAENSLTDPSNMLIVFLYILLLTGNPFSQLT